MLQHKPRKACDFCYRRRIKCDGKTPQCSSCALHGSICVFEAPSRKARSRRQDSSKDSEERLRLQVESLQSSLGQALKRVDELQSLVPPALNKTPNVLNDSLPGEYHQVDWVQEEPIGSDGRMPLPPLQEVLSAAEVYLTTLNAILPLFHPGRLLQMINNWYAQPGRQERKTWAAINVVLALAHGRIPPEEAILRSENAAYYLHNAQTVLSEVIMGDSDLVNVQIVLGMVLLFQGTRDLKPATMLIAVALRLAHELDLQTRRSECIEPSQTLERARVLWIAYILDRDISMRTGRPPIQRERDITLEWPSVEPDDGAGMMRNTDGTIAFNFFRYRVQLARIQGEVYDFVAATPAAGTMNDYQRSEDIVRLNCMLDDWISSIPPPFKPNSVLHTEQPNLCRSFAVLYATHLACRTQVYRAHAMDSGWMQTLRNFGKTASQQGRFIPAPLPTPSLQEWDKLVDETREFMRLFWDVERRDQAFIWMTACNYVSGSVCLTANIMFKPYHAAVEYDKSLVNLSISLLDDLIHQTGHKPLKDLQGACEELLSYARELSPVG
ncbi:uncharacterized protein PV06_09580 [Exophiala oligosperma]|uniref:Zn(2)-C6 fungal-type domain-containing protein n=1 Tax=Exophiala oligosperma TaxID=215243 RepID=A0A0D2D623_9EURO|nr:uncharacterized protein PV06_09580 [Exophiala oligosperma]KIW38628.1 hypothetical protein PV06_09580 [Exophiala oligosperma]